MFLGGAILIPITEVGSVASAIGWFAVCAAFLRMKPRGADLLIAFIGFQHAGLITADPNTMVTLGNIRNPSVELALLGLLIIVVLEVKQVRGAILIGVLSVTALAWA